MKKNKPAVRLRLQPMKVEDIGLPLGLKIMSVGKIRDLACGLGPTFLPDSKDGFEDDEEKLAYLLLRVVLGGPIRLLDEYPSIQKAVKRARRRR